MNPSSSVPSDTIDPDDLYWESLPFVLGGPPSDIDEDEPSTFSDEEEEEWLLGRTEEEAEEIWEKYATQVEESGGFDIDVDVYPGGTYAPYIPWPEFREDKKWYDMVKKMAREALKTFKDNSGKKYELVDVEKVVWTTNRLFYITFNAKQLDAPPDAKADDVVKTLQAVVGNAFSHYDVRSCRIKPTNQIE